MHTRRALTPSPLTGDQINEAGQSSCQEDGNDQERPGQRTQEPQARYQETASREEQQPLVRRGAPGWHSDT